MSEAPRPDTARGRLRLAFRTDHRLYQVFVVATAGIVAAALLCLSIASPSSLQPPVPSSFNSSGPSRLNGLMAVMGVLVVLWGISVHYRCSSVIVRQHLTLAISLLALLPLMPLARYTVHEAPTLGNLYWYAFYMAFVHVPTLLLLCAMHAAGLSDHPRARALASTDAAVAVVLVWLMLTNDLHHLAFFTPQGTAIVDEYLYGPLYWVVVAFIAANVVAFLLMLFRTARAQKRWTLSPLGVAVVGAGVYLFSYVTRLFGSSPNLAIDFVLLCAMIIEYVLDTRLFPSYIGYEQLFRSLPLRVSVLSNLLTPVLSTDVVTEPLPDEVMAALASQMPMERGSFVALPSPSGTVSKAFGVAGGVAVLTESTAEMDRRREQLQRTHDELERSNDMLRRRHEIQAALWEQQREQELFDDVNESLLWATNAIGTLLANLPSEHDEAAREERQRSLVLVRLLLAYCKRKGALVLDEQANSMLDTERLRLVLGETMADVALAGIDGGALVEVSHELPASTFSTIYDCLYDFVTISFVNDDPTLMVFLHDYGDNSVELRIAMECAQLDVSCADELRDLLSRRDVAYRLVEEDDALKLSVVVPRVVMR